MKSVIYIFFCLYIVNGYSQAIQQGFLVQYDPCTDCLTSSPQYQATRAFNPLNNDSDNIASDFGPRYLGSSPYNWHGGIDYSSEPNNFNQDKGYHLRAIEGGIIHAIYPSSATGAKAIIIEGPNNNFGYLHIFENGVSYPISVGDCKFVRLTSHPDEYGILTPGTNGQKLLAACPSGCQSRYYTENNIQIPADNIILPNQIIGVLGDSGVPGSAHLHLNNYESLAGCNSNWGGCDEFMLNPLEFVQYQSSNYNITMHNSSLFDSGSPANDPANEPLGFASNNIRYGLTDNNFNATSIMTRAALPQGGNGNVYSAATFDIQQVAIKIRNTLSAQNHLIYGPNFETRITYGGTTNNPLEYPEFINETNAASQGGWNKQGIYQFAYRVIRLIVFQRE